MNAGRQVDVGAQGRLLWMPYDWRRPTWGKVIARVWNPEAPLFTPKVWGWGFTLNLRHRRAWLVLAGAAAAGLASALLLS